jgi:signal transduction histidine kinase
MTQKEQVTIPVVKDKVNILMVDDQPGKLISYEAILSELGENLIQARSGREALEHLLKAEIAVVLMDVSMPEMDGFELADMIRQHPRFQKTAIIFISAVHLTDLDRVEGYERGAVDYISVPVNPELLRAKVSVFAELHRKSRQLEKLNSELHHLSGRLMATQDQERRRVARELHDGLGQDLSVAKMMLNGIRQRDISPDAREQAVADVVALLDRTIQNVRSLSHLLHPPLLDEVGLRSALQWYVDGLSRRSGIDTSLEVRPTDFPRLTPDLETAIFRIVQEALTNVFLHSEARKAWVTLAEHDNQIVVTVRDDGKGVDEQITELRPEFIGVGMGGMKQRVKEFGGTLILANALPGTLLEVIIPSSRAVSRPTGATA